jgi:predicted RNA-binding protein YlqC (UPF0109 family)
MTIGLKNLTRRHVEQALEGIMEIKDLIQRIAEALVDSPEQVTVTALEGSQATVLELKVAKEDLGKIIGKQGRTAKSIRTILGAASAKQNKRTVLEIVE